MFRKPGAYVPVAMSLAALGIVLARIALFGVAREPDEGAAAHWWQLLMGGQLPLIAVFMYRWLPRAPRAALLLFGLQAAAALAALAPVYFLKW